jgi:DNA-binding response OmpR family regulator
VALRQSSTRPNRKRPREARDLTIDFDRRRVLRESTEIRLTPKEFELLAFLSATRIAC